MDSDVDYDFFIAHAGADVAKAEIFFDLLARETKVFLDIKCLLPGDNWPAVIHAAQRKSRVTLVLVSDRTEQAFYEGEEIASAIALARDKPSEHRVVPIYLTERPPEYVPYGLRQKHALVVTEGISAEQIAGQLLDLYRILTADAPTRRVQIPLPPTRSGSGDHSLIEKIFCRDPVEGLPAAIELAETGQDAVPRVVGRLENLKLVDIACARTYLQLVPEESSVLMVDRILAAEDNWSAATQTPDCFTPQHRPYCEGALARHLTDGRIDVVRKCIESLGFLGADTWGSRIKELLFRFIPYDEDMYDKYEFYALLARARMFVQLESDPITEQWQLSTNFSGLANLITSAAKIRLSPHTFDELAKVLAGCQPRHADHLLGWLRSDHYGLKLLAAEALGKMRLRRALRSLGSAVSPSGTDPQVLDRAAFAIGNIGGADACELLTGLIQTRSEDAATAQRLRWALAYCIADAVDDIQFGQLAEDILSHSVTETCWVHRAVGIRKDDRFLQVLRDGTSDVEATVRGESALALARIYGASEENLLLRMHAEAGPSLERVLTKLALLAAGLEIPGDPEMRSLRAALAEESYLYNRLVTDDIVAILKNSENEFAAPIADAWQRIYTFERQGY